MNGLSISELSVRTGWMEEFLQGIVDDERARGHVVEVDGRFRLAPEFDLHYGLQLRQLGPVTEKT